RRVVKLVFVPVLIFKGFVQLPDFRVELVDGIEQADVLAKNDLGKVVVGLFGIEDLGWQRFAHCLGLHEWGDSVRAGGRARAARLPIYSVQPSQSAGPSASASSGTASS